MGMMGISMGGGAPAWEFITELKKQYDVQEVTGGPIGKGDYDALIVVQPSTLEDDKIDELLAAGRDDGRLSADTDVGGHLNDVDLAMFCVGAPSLLGGGQGLTRVGAVSEELGAALKTHDSARAYILENWTREARFLKPQADMISTLKDSAKPVNTVSSRDGG